MLKDVQENRLTKVGEGIAVGINDQLVNLKKSIDELPFQVIRTYSEEDLLITEKDSELLKKQKKRLTRWTKKPKTKVAAFPIDRICFCWAKLAAGVGKLSAH